MKKLTVLIIIIGLFTTSTKAQKRRIEADQKELKNTIKDKKEDRKVIAKDVAHLRLKKAVQGRKKVRHHRKNIHHQGKHLENNGVKHPIIKAKQKAKAEKEMEKSKS